MNSSFYTPRGAGLSPMMLRPSRLIGAKALIGLLGLILGYTFTLAASAESANSASAANPNAASSPNVNGSGKTKQLPAVADAAAIAARARAFDEAKSLVQHGNLAAVEERLAEQNNLPANSVESHREIANQLAALAGAMARENNPEAVSALASRALQHLTDAHGLATDVYSKSRIKAHAGWIQENLIGDVPAAIASYQAAVDLSPNNKAAKEALARLTAMDASLRAKIQAVRQ